MRAILIVLCALLLCPLGAFAASPTATLTMTYTPGPNDPLPTQMTLLKKVQGGAYAPLTQIPYGTTMTYQDTALTAGQTVCYQASPSNAAGNGPASNEACAVITPPLVPPTGATQVQITITWQ